MRARRLPRADADAASTRSPSCGAEVFGPVLHVLRFDRRRLAELVDSINATGYGLTLGIASRIDATINEVIERARVGNVYVNRNIIGAVIGVASPSVAKDSPARGQRPEGQH